MHTSFKARILNKATTWWLKKQTLGGVSSQECFGAYAADLQGACNEV